MSTSEFDTKYRGENIVVSVDNETGNIVQVFIKVHKLMPLRLNNGDMIRLQNDNEDSIREVLNENSILAKDEQQQINDMSSMGRYL